MDESGKNNEYNFPINEWEEVAQSTRQIANLLSGYNTEVEHFTETINEYISIMDQIHPEVNIYIGNLFHIINNYIAAMAHLINSIVIERSAVFNPYKRNDN